MTTPADWATDGRDWPNRATSRFVHASGLRWHVQDAGDPSAPAMLLLHGTGAATHSWAHLLPLLARDARVIAPDLPGHGFTTAPPDAAMSLAGMANAVAELLRALDVRPAVVIGHSAGAAILARLAIDGTIAPRLLISLNGAMVPLDSMPMNLFGPIARLLGASPLLPRLFAWHAADRRVVDRLLASTGSAVPPDIARHYAQLMRRSGHAAAALAMMARWDLPGLARDLPRLPVPLVMINGAADRTIPAESAARLRTLLPHSRLTVLPGLGHLAHEEQAEQVAALIRATVADSR